MPYRTAPALAPVPSLHGTHCAGIGCERDELAGSGLEAVAPGARTTARHRLASRGRRARLQLTPVPLARAAAHSA